MDEILPVLPAFFFVPPKVELLGCRMCAASVDDVELHQPSFEENEGPSRFECNIQEKDRQ